MVTRKKSLSDLVSETKSHRRMDHISLLLWRIIDSIDMRLT